MSFRTPHARFDAYKENLAELVTGHPVVPAWSPDGTRVAWVDGSPGRRTAWQVDLATGERSALGDTAKIRHAVEQALESALPGDGFPFEYLAFTDTTSVVGVALGRQVRLDLISGVATAVPAERALDAYLGASDRARATPQTFARTKPLMDPQPALEVPSPDGRWMLATQDGRIRIRSVYDSVSTFLTEPPVEGVEWRFDLTDPMLAVVGMAVPTTNWSPDGSLVAAYEVDERGVATLPRVHMLHPDHPVVRRAAPRAGGRLETYRLVLLDVRGGLPVEIQLGDTRDTYPVFAGWLPDSRSLLVFAMSRDCRQLQVLRADARSGAVQPILRESGDTFLRMHHDVYYGRKLGLWPLADGNGFLWLSGRDGCHHLYRYDLDGTLVGQLTAGPWPVEQVEAEADGWVYFTGRSDQQRPYDRHLHRVSLAGGSVERLTEEPGVHSIVFAPSRNAFLDTWSLPHSAPKTALRRIDGTLLSPVGEADTSALRQLGWTPPEQFSVPAADGETDLWGVMFFPHDFDPTKSYPVAEYIYGGPQIAVAPHAFTTAADPFGVPPQALAQLGCIAIMLDSRGTPGRSQAFHSAGYGEWLSLLADDHAGALLQLASSSRPYLDLSRTAVIGFSWGGYSALRCVLDRPDVYQAAVSMASGFDPAESLLYECYLGLPQDNPDGYRNADLTLRAAQLERPLLMVSGTADYNSWHDTIRMTEALIRAGKRHELLVMPEQGHGYDGPHDAYVWTRIQEFLGQHLGTQTAL